MAQPAMSPTTSRRRRSSGPRVGELIDAFLDQLASGGASTHTFGAYRRDLRGVADRLAAARGLDDVSRLRPPQVDSAAPQAGGAASGPGHAPPPRPPAPAAPGSSFTPPPSQGHPPAHPPTVR